MSTVSLIFFWLTVHVWYDKVVSMKNVQIVKEPIVAQCDGCGKRVLEPAQYVCQVYIVPAAKWKNGNCPMATNINKEITSSAKVNPLKASKRSVKGR